MNIVKLPRKEHLKLDRVEEIMSETDRAVIPVSGDCLEGAGVQDGGWVAVDFNRTRHRPGTRAGAGTVPWIYACAMPLSPAPESPRSCAKLMMVCGALTRW